MKFRPLHDKILARRGAEETKTPGGIIVPDVAKQKSREAEVLAVGTGHLNKDGTIRPLTVKVGDVVVFSAYAGTELKLDGEEFLLLSEEDLLAVKE